ncbi:glycosyltransferase family 9 protein [Dyella sp. EPa41]|uniref:glycosyltransferase family 9 protein n=1 Tax=Dyella sp. EPa41 TaxID=1561194 RepID=UPI00191660B1|nr:glycosyltransferase family 9 protein [Dyella sp. EPa41]
MQKTGVRAVQDPLPKKGVYRILVCRPNHRLGNTILLTPLITELERLYKGAEIDILSEGSIAEEVFSTFFSIKNVYCLPKRGFKRPIPFLGKLLRIRKTQYDLIIDPCLGSGFSRVLTKFLSGRFKLGFSDDAARSGLTHAVPTSVARAHMAQRPINLLRWACGRHADESGTTDAYPSLDIRLADEERAHGRAVIAQLLPPSHQGTLAPVIGIFANATGAKRYPASWWSEFIEALGAMSPQSRLLELIPMHGHSMLGEAWPGYYSSDIRRMGAVMAGMDLMITADCGVMHLAVASKVPTVGMFCVTDASVYAPYGLGSCPLMTHGLSAREAAEHVMRHFPELLGPDGSIGHAAATDASLDWNDATGLGSLGLSH